MSTEYSTQRLQRHLDRVGTKEYRKEKYIFYRNDDPETTRRATLPSLIAYLAPRLPRTIVLPKEVTSSVIAIDHEGKIYDQQWIPTDRIPIGAKILTTTKSDRDYHLNPPKNRRIIQLTFPEISKGIDVALRRKETILEKYCEGGKERKQTAELLAFLDERRQLSGKISGLSEEQLKAIQENGVRFVERQGWINSQHPDKEKVREMLPKGYTDKRGRGNDLAVWSRDFSLKCSLGRREVASNAIVNKFLPDANLLNFTRTITREAFVMATGQLVDLQEQLNYPSDGLSEGEKSQVAEQQLRQISKELNKVIVRPYILGARKAMEHFGIHCLPEGTIARHLQNKRVNPTVRQYLREEKFAEAISLIGYCNSFLQKILDYHEDYLTVKKSPR